MCDYFYILGTLTNMARIPMIEVKPSMDKAQDQVLHDTQAGVINDNMPSMLWDHAS